MPIQTLKLFLVWIAVYTVNIPENLSAQISAKQTMFDRLKDDSSLKEALRGMGLRKGLKPDQIEQLSELPGSITLNVATVDTRLKNLEDLLRSDALKMLTGKVGKERVIGEPDFNPYNPAKNSLELGSPELMHPGILWTEDKKRDFWKSRSRPLLDPSQVLNDQRKRFLVSPPAKQGMEAELKNQLDKAWASLTKLSKHVLRFEGLGNHGTGSGIMLDHKTILTAGHVASQVTENTALIWPALSGKPTVRLKGVVHLDVIHGLDLAIINIENAPQELQNASINVDKKLPANLENCFIVALGCPPSFGTITANDLLFQKLFGHPGAVYASPGLIRGSMNTKEISHDCSTDPGSSGSAIFLLPECKLIGVQIRGDDINLNKFVPLEETGLLP